METANAEIKYGISTYLGGFLEDWRHSVAPTEAICFERRADFSARLARLVSKPEELPFWAAELDRVAAAMVAALEHLMGIVDLASTSHGRQYAANPAWASRHNHDASHGAKPAVEPAPDDKAGSTPVPAAPDKAQDLARTNALIEQAMTVKLALLAQQLDKQIKAEVKRSLAARQGHWKQDWEKLLDERLSQTKSELEQGYEAQSAHLKATLERRLSKVKHLITDASADTSAHAQSGEQASSPQDEPVSETDGAARPARQRKGRNKARDFSQVVE